MNTILKLAACIAATIAIWGFALASATQAQSCAPKTFPGTWKGEVTLCQNWDAD